MLLYTDVMTFAEKQTKSYGAPVLFLYVRLYALMLHQGRDLVHAFFGFSRFPLPLTCNGAICTHLTRRARAYC
jgi:hypothetical protein